MVTASKKVPLLQNGVDGNNCGVRVEDHIPRTLANIACLFNYKYQPHNFAFMLKLMHAWEGVVYYLKFLMQCVNAGFWWIGRGPQIDVDIHN